MRRRLHRGTGPRRRVESAGPAAGLARSSLARSSLARSSSGRTGRAQLPPDGGRTGSGPDSTMFSASSAREHQMKSGLKPAVAAVTAAVTVTVALIIWLALQPRQFYPPLSLLMPATFTAMGSLIVTRQPRNLIGWIVLLSGPLAAIGFATDGWAVRSFARAAGPLPLGTFAAWTANLILGSHLLFLVIGLLFLLFPDGRLPSPRWRWLLWYGAFVYGVLAVSAALWSADATKIFPHRILPSLLPGQAAALTI